MQPGGESAWIPDLPGAACELDEHRLGAFIGAQGVTQASTADGPQDGRMALRQQLEGGLVMGQAPAFEQGGISF
jgi:hypothetical protein